MKHSSSHGDLTKISQEPPALPTKITRAVTYSAYKNKEGVFIIIDRNPEEAIRPLWYISPVTSRRSSESSVFSIEEDDLYSVDKEPNLPSPESIASSISPDRLQYDRWLESLFHVIDVKDEWGIDFHWR